MSNMKKSSFEGEERLTNGEKSGHLKETKMDIPLVGDRSPSGSQNKILKQIKKKVPILSWLPTYNADMAVSDLIAGVTVGLTVIPQGIAYALVANLPPEYGLYSAFMGCFMYMIFGSCKDITIGPTAIMAIMTGDVFAEGEAKKFGSYYAVLLAFTSGLIIFLFGIFQLGFLIDFISMPVIAGFTSAAAITIASGQIKGLLGIYTLPENENHTETHAGVVDDYYVIFDNIETVRWQDATLGIICAIILLAMRFIGRSPTFKAEEGQTRGRYILNKAVWFVCTSRNAIIVILCLIMSAIMNPNIEECKKEFRKTKNYTCTFMLTGEIDGRVPPFAPPPFSIPANATGDGEPHEEINFSGMLSELGSAIIIIPIIAILESIAIAKAFSGGKTVDASQEMVALGICNVFGAFVSSMPTTGSFSRTAVNSSSGVKTPLGGLYTGALVLLCLGVLMPYCAFIPKATLSAVIMTAVIFSVEYEVVLPIWKSKRIDLIPGFVCFFVGLFSELDYGIFVGVGLHIAIVLYQIARPRVSVEMKVVGRDSRYLLVCPDQAIIFPSATFIRTLISKAGEKQGGSKLPIVIDCNHIINTDFTAAKGFKAMLVDFQKRGQDVHWLKPGLALSSVLESVAGAAFSAINRVEDIFPEISNSEPLLDSAVTTYQNQDAEVQP